MQFGADAKLAAQCMPVPAPDGWRPWSDGVDGIAPDGLKKRAAALEADPTIPLGTTESYPIPGVTTLIRVEPRVWGKDDRGNLVQGCFRTAGIFLPSALTPAAPPPISGWTKAATVLTVASLTVGTVATIASMRGGRR